MHDLGYILSYWGEGVEVNREEAFEWFSKAAAAGDTDSIVRLADFYRYGRVAELDKAKAAELFLEAAKKGHERAPDYILAMHNQKEYEFPPEEIFRIAKNAAEDKPPRKTEFGMRAEEPGDPTAQRLLGDLYKDGVGTQRNLSAAVKWYRKAAEAGDIRAQVSLATMYETGLGIAKSPEQAFKWFYKAATSNDAPDEMKRSRLHCLNEGAEDSTVDPSIIAAVKSGEMLINGEGTKKDTEAGIQLLEKAANSGQLEAMHLLGVIFSSGQGIKKDHELGVEWLRKAAAEGHQASIDTLVALGVEN